MRIFLLILGFCCFAPAKAEDSVPVYNFKQLQERVLQKNDTLYVVNFWATWCKPCVEEMPRFEAIRQLFWDKAIKFIFVSQDSKKSGVKVAQFMAANNYPSEAFILSAGNPNIWIDEIDPKWSGTIPATVLYKNGKKLDFKEGEFVAQIDLEYFIQANLKE